MKRNDSDRQPIYSVLAPLYDHIMRDVDYEAWADYIDDLIQLHTPYSEQLLELACGTGSVSLSLGELGYYRILATDQSRQMIQVARKKSEETDSPVRFRPMNFLNIQLKQTFDVVFMVFDSLNYLHTEQEILQLHNEVKNVLRPGGFLYSTTQHHATHERQFDIWMEKKGWSTTVSDIVKAVSSMKVAAYIPTASE
ncbi:MAG: class I SAM-dependent methyltransferase [Balneolaceae bacterium]